MKSFFGGRHWKTDFSLLHFCIFSIENDNGGHVGNQAFQRGRGEKPKIKQIVKNLKNWQN